MDIAKAIEDWKLSLAEAEEDIQKANDMHKKRIAEAQALFDEANTKHRQALTSAMERKLEAQGAIKALERLAEAGG